jgi:hypothetical protein
MIALERTYCHTSQLESKVLNNTCKKQLVLVDLALQPIKEHMELNHLDYVGAIATTRARARRKQKNKHKLLRLTLNNYKSNNYTISYFH